ncbi:MAG: hypothetical protein JNL98_19760 [Bryobacterales bacterium]|nr:hypothetical protein [Bryobacterales bacterium]
MENVTACDRNANDNASESFFRHVFLAGALWNLIVGLFLFLFADSIYQMAGLRLPSPPVHFYCWIALFMTFGVGYAMAWRNPVANRGIVLLGIIGKLALSVVFLASMAAAPDQIPRFFLIPVNGDLVFAGLFWAYLQSSSRHSKSDSSEAPAKRASSGAES